MTDRTSHTNNNKNLTPDELELYQLCRLGGVALEPATFKIILGLLRMNISPHAVFHMLKAICADRRKHKAQMKGDHGAETENVTLSTSAAPTKSLEPV